MFRKFLALFCILLFCVCLCFSKSGSLSATDILDAYKKAMENSLFHREKSAFKVEKKQKDKLTYKTSAGYETEISNIISKTIFFHDCNRIDYRSEEEILEFNKVPVTSKSQYLLDNEYGFNVFHSLGECPRYISLYTKSRWRFAIKSLGPSGKAFEGYMVGDSHKPLWEVLKEEQNLKLRDEMEEIDGHKTYVLEAKTNHGHYMLWIDPNCGFNLRRCVVRREDNDLMNGEPLNKPPVQPPSPELGRPRFPTIEYIFTLDSFKFENFAGLFLPVEGIVTTNEKYSNGDEYNVQYSYKRFDIDLDPDFSKFENAFVLDVPNGTPVHNMDDPDSGESFIWQDGKIIPIDIQH